MKIRRNCFAFYLRELSFIGHVNGQTIIIKDSTRETIGFFICIVIEVSVVSYAVSKPAHDLSTAKFVACLSISFSHLFFRVFFAWCKIECKYLMFGWLLDLHLHTNTSLDVSEESEMDLWSDRFGSWIGRSSKSKSPDSMKHLRYDRKSSSGYLIGSRISCWCWFLHYLFARTLHNPKHLIIPPKTASSCECFYL